MIRYLRRRAFARGVLGDNGSWLAVWAVLASIRVVRRIARPKTKVLFHEALAPGEVIVIRHGEPSPEG